MTGKTKDCDGDGMHDHTYPPYRGLDFTGYARIDGLQSLGFIAQHRPDIHIVTDRLWSRYHADTIIPEIETALVNNKKVGLFFMSPDFMMPNENSKDLLERLTPFADEPVYLCSDLDDECLLIYQEQFVLPIKSIYVPWCISNFVFNLDLVTSEDFDGPCGPVGLQFACYANRLQQHREDLKNLLIDQQWTNIGDIQYAGKQLGSGSIHREWRTQSEFEILKEDSNNTIRSLFFHSDTGRWVCHNAINLMRLKEQLGDIPLVIQSDSTTGLFPITEKSIWPIMLQRLFMIYGRPRLMQTVQKFLSYDIASYLDLEFDSIDGWTLREDRLRLECMIEKNQYLITHAREFWIAHRPKLLQARYDLPYLIYQQFCNGLKQII